MKSVRLILFAFTAIISFTVKGQLFRPLGLGIETPSLMVVDFQPQIHIEGDILFACTLQGLYSKDLSDKGSEWQLAGFDGVPVLDYVRRGDDVFAMCFNERYDVFLLSHDGGQTYEDATPDIFRDIIQKEGHTFWYFNQHPTDPGTFLLTSFHGPGMFKTTDFGQTWEKLADYTPDYMGFHPLNPSIIYECGGGGFTDEKTDVRISYDGGQTWQEKAQCFPNYSHLFRMAFHPTNPDKWIAGGYRSVYATNDGGKTWETHYLSVDNPADDSYHIDWRYAAYDNDNSDIIYMAGGHQTQYMKLMCSTDGGITWNRPCLEPIKTTPYDFVFDMKQYSDKLLVYSQSDVYEVSKAELIAATSPSEPVTFTIGQMATIILPTEPDASKGKYYRLDRVKDGQIVFEQERQPQARVPYIIVPDEDFSIEPETLELAGLSADTVTVGGIRFIGTYCREVLSSPGGEGEGSFYYDIIDQTPDCSPLPGEGLGEGLAVVGALRAYLQVPWDDPFDHGGSKVPSKKMEIVLKDNPNSLSEIKNEELEIRNVGGIYDLQGRKMVNGQRTTYNGQRTTYNGQAMLDGRRESQRTIVNGQWPRIYIQDGRKVVKRASFH